MQNNTETRRMVLEAAIKTIASACRHLYEEDIQAAKTSGDIMGLVRTKAAMQRDWEAWTAPLTEALNALDDEPLIITVLDAPR